MADLSDRKKQNQAFLQELEKQRLAKDCNRSIDLRGKVPGECQQYDIGGCRHYLDDRGYLLLKQLMSRVNDRYTVGVYEALLKAIRQYSNTVDTLHEDSDPSPLLLALDRQVERQEQRLIITTPVSIEHGELRYSGSTIDLASNSLRIALKRTHSLSIGDIVSITFTDWQQQQPALSAIRYQLLRLDHHEANSTAVLLREAADPMLDDWFERWLTTQAEARPVDRDNELLNLQSLLYQRLWLSHQAAIVVWLTTQTEQPTIRAIHSSPQLDSLLAQQQYTLAEVLHALPLAKLIQATPSPCLIAHDKQHAYLGKLTDSDRIEQLLSWQQAGANRRLLFARMDTVQMDLTADQLSRLNAIDPQSEQSQSLLSAISHQLRLTDITDIVPVNPTDSVQQSSLDEPVQAVTVQPSVLGLTIQRAEQRFYIKTPINVQIDGDSVSLDTWDVSVDGLSVLLPLTQIVRPEMTINVDFLRWQTLAPQVTLRAVPYQIKTCQPWHDGLIRVGLQRITQQCSSKLNQFFAQVIKQNQAKLRHNVDDQIQNHENPILQDKLVPALHSMPVFLGTDNNGKRRIQLVGKTTSNHANLHSADFWLTVSERFARVNEPFNRHATDISKTDVLYGYHTAFGQWKLALHSDFASAQEKHIFIRLALKNPEFVAFHCVFSSFNTAAIEQHQDILRRLSERPTHHSHREREIRQQLHRLYGLAELTDISQLVSLQYAS